MLGKLLKQEWKATSRMLLPLYLVLVCTTFITSLLVHWDNQFKHVLTMISMLPYVISLVLIAAGTTIFLFVRFYKNLLTDEGYLMFTLPVKTNQLVQSKLLTATVFSIVNIAVIGLSIFLVACASGNYQNIAEEFNNFITEIINASGLSLPLLLLEAAALFILSILSSILTVYLAIALGQLFTGHRIIGAFVSYGALYLIMQFLSLAAVFILILVKGMSYLDQAGNTAVLIMLPLMLVINCVCYYGTVKLLRTKLNLE